MMLQAELQRYRYNCAQGRDLDRIIDVVFVINLCIVNIKVTLVLNCKL